MSIVRKIIFIVKRHYENIIMNTIEGRYTIEKAHMLFALYVRDAYVK